MHNTIMVCGKAQSSKIVWLTEKQVANLIHCSLSKLRQDRHKCKGLPYTKFGRSVRYSLVDVEEFMQANRTTPLQ